MINNDIMGKIVSLKKEFPFLEKFSNDYIFNALNIQTIFFKNPSNELNESVLKDIIVDGCYDGGIDCILNDFDSDDNDIIFMQNKFYETISLEKIKDALSKMYGAYKQLKNGEFSYFKEELVTQYSKCNYEFGSEGNIVFYFCTCAPQSGIKMKSIINYFNSLIGDENIKLEVLFEKNIVDKIIDFDSLRRSVNNGKIAIDFSNNYLSYSENDDGNEDAIVINGSAWSIKKLYSLHHLALFSQNLRYFVKSKNIDDDIRKSIAQYKKQFWYKNNGITIICEDFEISGKEVHLTKFSIINGGQTTSLIGNSDLINENNDFYLPIKIIRVQGEDDLEKQKFIFNIAIATNSQKAIKPSDLKANEPEQILFSTKMKQLGLFYRTKRGEEIPKNYKEKYLNLDLNKAGKLALAGIYMLPGTSRSNPSIIYKDNQSYYETIFVKKMEESSLLIKDLLFADVYFDTNFKKEYQKHTTKMTRITFANNARTLCLSYIGFLNRYMNGFITKEEVEYINNVVNYTEDEIKHIQRIFANSINKGGLYNKKAYENLDDLSSKLYKVFSFICKNGSKVYDLLPNDEKKDESNWLKSNVSFYKILSQIIDDLDEEIEDNEDAYNVFKLI